MNLKKSVWGFAVLGLLAMPAVTMAGVNLNVNLGAAPAHYDFTGPRHHNPTIWKAAQKLRQAEVILTQARSNFRGHKANALAAIDAALDQLSICEHR